MVNRQIDKLAKMSLKWVSNGNGAEEHSEAREEGETEIQNGQLQSKRTKHIECVDSLREHIQATLSISVLYLWFVIGGDRNEWIQITNAIT